MRKNALILLTVLFVSFSATAYAEEQQQTTPEQQQQMMEQAMSNMLPFMGQMMKIMLHVQFEVLAEPETADKLATFTRNYYEALLKKGFSKDEALKIVMNMQIPSLPNMNQ